jgi:putative transposase
VQLHLSGLSLLNIVSIIEIFDIERARSTVHNWIHKADLQSTSVKSSDDVAFDETVIRYFTNESNLPTTVTAK